MTRLLTRGTPLWATHEKVSRLTFILPTAPAARLIRNLMFLPDYPDISALGLTSAMVR